MKQLLLLLTIISFGFHCNAQISIEKDTVVQMGTAQDFEIIAKNTIYNNFTSDDTLRWIRINQNLSGDWLAASCDNEACWFPEQDSSQFIVPANGTSNLDIYFYNQNTEGSGEVKILLYRISKGRAFGDTIVYKATTDATVGLQRKTPIQNLKIYPNPVTDQLTIQYQEETSIKVRIIQKGEIIFSDKINSNSTLDFSQYTSGTYILELSNESYRSAIKVNKQ